MTHGPRPRALQLRQAKDKLLAECLAEHDALSALYSIAVRCIDRAVGLVDDHHLGDLLAVSVEKPTVKSKSFAAAMHAVLGADVPDQGPLSEFDVEALVIAPTRLTNLSHFCIDPLRSPENVLGIYSRYPFPE